MKHALYLELLRSMRRKDKPFMVLDTHAGTGKYDLATGPAARTGEFQTGIARLLAARPPAVAEFCDLVDQLGLYPGSPAIAAAMLRPADRLVVCELHGQDAAALKRHFAEMPLVAVHARDGYAALNAFLPPPERRGLILIDPPYERGGEFETLAAALAAATRKFATGVYAAWYPIKHRAPVRDFHAALATVRNIVIAELWLRPPLDPARLNGCGLLVINPPHGFTERAADILAGLAPVLGAADAGWDVARLTDE